MDEDNVRREHSNTTEEWAQHFLDEYDNSGVEKLASIYREGQECKWQLRKNGSFNSCHKVLFKDGVAWAIRFPIPGRVMHPEEKIRREVEVMKFIQHKTNIPVPKIVAFGTAADNHDHEIGPFLITTWVQGVSLTSIMEELPRPEYGPILRDDINEKDLRNIYGQMANVLLELSLHDFDKIGALTAIEDETESWSICSRPMTLKMNDIESGGYVVADNHKLPAYQNTTQYMTNLIQQNMKHLHGQRNSIDDAEDARNKYVLRHQMREAIPYFSANEVESGPFKLFCEDFRPGNVLVDEETLKIQAVIDWEWTYTAPRQFLYSPPPWLILERPTSWTEYGEEHYQKRLVTFLECLEAVEQKRNLPEEQRMSTQMRQYAEDGTFWIVQLLQDAFNFDGEVFVRNIKKLLEKRGLGDIGVPRDDEIERFVMMKMKDLDEYKQDLQALERSRSERAEITNAEAASD